MNVARHILLIEPNKILASQTADFLMSKGYQVTVAYTAQSAIVAADHTSPDIVILEVLLAKHSGIEFLYEFRSYNEWQHIPVIVFSRVTGSELALSPRTITNLRIDAVLYKPSTSFHKLETRIRKSLQDVLAV